MGSSNVLGAFSVIIEIAVIVLNSLAIYAGGYVKAKREKSEIDDIIICLSGCTIGFVLFSTPFGLMTYFKKGTEGGTETCALYQVSATWYQLFCVFLISCLAINFVRRGQRLIKAQYNHRIWKRTFTYVMVLFILMLTLSVAIFPVLGLAPDIRNSSDINKTCRLWISLNSDYKNEQIFVLTYLVFGFFHLLCLIISVPLILRYIRRVKRQLCIDLCSQESNFLMERDIIRRRFIDNSRMVILVAGMFYFSWIPNLVMVTLNKTNYKVSETAILYAILGTTMTGLLNPLAYAYWDKSYRTGYRQALERVIRFCTCNKWKSSDITAVSMKTTSISHNSTVMTTTGTTKPFTYHGDRSEDSVINPACKDLVCDMCQSTATSSEIVETSQAAAKIIHVPNKAFDNIDDGALSDSYSVESDSELFISENRLDVLEDNLRHKKRSRGNLSETSDSSLTTEHDFLDPSSSYTARYVDESIM